MWRYAPRPVCRAVRRDLGPPGGPAIAVVTGSRHPLGSLVCEGQGRAPCYWGRGAREADTDSVGEWYAVVTSGVCSTTTLWHCLSIGCCVSGHCVSLWFWQTGK